MKDLRTWFETSATHNGKSMMILAVITHGDRQEWLYSADKPNRIKGWHIQDLVYSLCTIKTLLGKPKVLFLQACRGSK